MSVSSPWDSAYVHKHETARIISSAVLDTLRFVEPLIQISPGCLSSGRVASLLSWSCGAGAFCCRGSGAGSVLFCSGSRIVVRGMVGRLVCSVLPGDIGSSVLFPNICLHMEGYVHMCVCVHIMYVLYMCVPIHPCVNTYCWSVRPPFLFVVSFFGLLLFAMFLRLFLMTTAVFITPNLPNYSPRPWFFLKMVMLPLPDIDFLNASNQDPSTSGSSHFIKHFLLENLNLSFFEG